MTAWLIAGTPAKLGDAVRTAFPSVASFLECFLKLGEISVRVERPDKSSERLILDFPLDLAATEKHYESVANLLRHFDYFSMTIRHPETKAVLLTVTLNQEHVVLSQAFVGGQPAWSAESGEWAGGSEEQLVAWSAGGTFVVDMELES